MNDIEAIRIIDGLMLVVATHKLTDDHGQPLSGAALENVRDVSTAAMEYLMRMGSVHPGVANTLRLWAALADRGIMT